MRLALLLPVAGLVGLAAGYASYWRPPPSGPPGRNTTSKTQNNSQFAGIAPPAAVAINDKAARFLEALQYRRDPLRCEHDLFLALQEIEARDFNLLTGDPAGVIALIMRFEDAPLEVSQAMADGAVNRWLEVDPAGALAWFRRSCDLYHQNDYGSEWVLRALARQRAKEVFDFVLTLPEGGRRSSAARILFEELGSADLPRAREWLDRLGENNGTRKTAESAWRIAMARVDPIAAMDIADSTEDRRSANELRTAAIAEATRRGPGVLRTMATATNDFKTLNSIATAMCAYDPEEAGRLAVQAWDKAEPAERWPARGTIGRVAEAFARSDVMRATEWADTLPAETRAFALTEVAKTWAVVDPQAAVEWFSLHPAEIAVDPGTPISRRVDATTEAFAVWLRADEKSARAWADALPPGEASNVVQARLILYLTQNQRVDQAAELCANFSGDNTGMVAMRVAEALGKSDPLSAVRWSAELPAGPTQVEAMAAAVSQWARVDPQAAANWIGQFPEGNERDRAVTAYVRATASVDPTAAAEWVLEVNDSWQRTRAAQSVLRTWNSRDPSAARSWFQALPGLNETIRRQILRTWE